MYLSRSIVSKETSFLSLIKFLRTFYKTLLAKVFEPKKCCSRPYIANDNKVQLDSLVLKKKKASRQEHVPQVAGITLPLKIKRNAPSCVTRREEEEYRKKKEASDKNCSRGSSFHGRCTPRNLTLCQQFRRKVH